MWKHDVVNHFLRLKEQLPCPKILLKNGCKTTAAMCIWKIETIYQLIFMLPIRHESNSALKDLNISSWDKDEPSPQCCRQLRVLRSTQWRWDVWKSTTKNIILTTQWGEGRSLAMHTNLLPHRGLCPIIRLLNIGHVLSSLYIVQDNKVHHNCLNPQWPIKARLPVRHVL